MLGVLGGMGPMATVDFMAKLVRNTPARRDQDHIEMLVCSAAGIPDRTAAIVGPGPDPFPSMLEALRRLESAGASLIAIPCSTAHHWHGDLQAETQLPILHIADALADALARKEAKERAIGLLATDGTIRTRVYQDRLAERGFACILPEANGQAEIMTAIRLVKAGRTRDAGMLLQRQARALLARGSPYVAMACTEIPLALSATGGEMRSRLLDPTDALARACIDACKRRAEITGSAAA